MKKGARGRSRRIPKTRCRVAGCELCAWQERMRTRTRSRLGPGSKVTLAHIVRGLRALGDLPPSERLRPGGSLGKPAKDRLDQALFRPRGPERAPGVECPRGKK